MRHALTLLAMLYAGAALATEPENSCIAAAARMLEFTLAEVGDDAVRGKTPKDRDALIREHAATRMRAELAHAKVEARMRRMGER